MIKNTQEQSLGVRNKKGSRTGFTTGACAAAAAKAAVRFLVEEKKLESIDSILPNRQKVTFTLNRCERNGTSAITSIIKDAGDDPDCTHGAEITTTVTLTKKKGIALINGQGVGVITKQGLGIDIGEPSITPIPRKNIIDMVMQELKGSDDFYGAKIIISVPDGEERAKKTINARLGVLGGISILGTTGIVKPYSTAAFCASVVQEIEVARAQGIDEVVFTTGGRSEAYALRIFKDLPEESFIQVGDFIGAGLKSSVKSFVKCVHIVGMIGKLSKIADGKMQTHVSKSKVNMKLLAALAKKAGVDQQLCQKMENANTARHVLELVQKENLDGFVQNICRDASRISERYVENRLEVYVYMFDFNGTLLTQYPKG